MRIKNHNITDLCGVQHLVIDESPATSGLVIIGYAGDDSTRSAQRILNLNCGNITLEGSVYVDHEFNDCQGEGAQPLTNASLTITQNGVNRFTSDVDGSYRIANLGAFEHTFDITSTLSDYTLVEPSFALDLTDTLLPTVLSRDICLTPNDLDYHSTNMGHTNIDLGGNFTQDPSQRSAAKEAAPSDVILSASPNPTYGNLRLNSTAPIHHLRIHDTQGRLLRATQVHKPTTTLSLEIADFSAGTYLIEVQTEHGHEVKRIVKI